MRSMKKPSASAVLYLRMSSEKQDRSIDAQREAIQRYAAENGYRIVGEYRDEAVSGWKADERGDFQRLISDAGKGRFEVILCWDQDRFSRFPVLEANHYWYLLDKSGVQIVTVNQGPLNFSDLAGWLTASITQHGKAEYVRDLSRNTLRGKIRGAEAGEWVTCPPLGYLRDGRRLVLGEQRDIKTVQRVFRLYLDGYSTRGVADVLNREGLPTRKGAKWSSDTVRKILMNPAYVGDVVWNRNSTGQFHKVTAERTLGIPRLRNWRPNPKEDWIVRQDMHEPIIDRQMFDAVQQRLKDRFFQRAPKRNGGKFLFSSIVHCARCGAPMCGRTLRRKVRDGWHEAIYYSCSSYQRCGRSTCFSFHVPQDRLVELLTRKVQEHMALPENMNRLRTALSDEVAKAQRPTDASRLRRELKQIDGKLEKYRRRLLECDSDMLPTVQDAIRRLTSEQDQTRAALALATTSKQDVQRSHVKIIEQAITRLGSLRTAIEAADPMLARNLFRSVFRRVDAHFERTERRKRAKHVLTRLDIEIDSAELVPNMTPSSSRPNSRPGTSRTRGPHPSN